MLILLSAGLDRSYGQDTTRIENAIPLPFEWPVSHIKLSPGDSRYYIGLWHGKQGLDFGAGGVGRFPLY